jgi:hypothetical protein
VNHCIAGRTNQEYYQDNKEILSEQNQKNHKIWGQNNKAHLYNYLKEWKLKTNYLGQKIECSCGVLYSKAHHSHHIKTQTHIHYEQNKDM